MESRNKGKRFEREAAELVRLAFGDLGGADARRNLQQASEGGEDLLSDLPLVVEVAGGKCPSPITKLRQAESAARLAKLRGRVPGHAIACALVRRDREDWTMTVSWRDAARLLRAWIKSCTANEENDI